MNHLVFFTQPDSINPLIRSLAHNACVDSGTVCGLSASALINGSGIRVSDALTLWLKHDASLESEFTRFAHGIPAGDRFAMFFHFGTNAAIRAMIEGQGNDQTAWYAGTLAETYRAREGHHAEMLDGSHVAYFALARYLVLHLSGQQPHATELNATWLSFQHG